MKFLILLLILTHPLILIHKTAKAEETPSSAPIAVQNSSTECLPFAMPKEEWHEDTEDFSEFIYAVNVIEQTVHEACAMLEVFEKIPPCDETVPLRACFHKHGKILPDFFSTTNFIIQASVAEAMNSCSLSQQKCETAKELPACNEYHRKVEKCTLDIFLSVRQRYCQPHEPAVLTGAQAQD